VFLHVGAEVSVRTKDVVAIVDLKAARTSAATKEFLDIMKEENTLSDISDGDPKSFIVTVDRVFLSPISASTLAKRAFSSNDHRNMF
jgi:extracellular matrix regulatory protein B